MTDQERGARIIQRAIELMKQGKSKGWSDALAQATKQIK
jgi:hypothetical protein